MVMFLKRENHNSDKWNAGNLHYYERNTSRNQCRFWN